MNLLPLIGMAGFLIVATVIGIRMLLLARQTGGLPESLLGAGLTGMTLVGLPASIAAQVLKSSEPETAQGLVLLSQFPTVIFVGCLYGFTAAVFRSGKSWAQLFVLTILLTTATASAASGAQRVRAWGTPDEMSQATGLVIFAIYIGGLFWTGAESLRHWRAGRRQLAVGLGDPVVVDRFRLWALGGLSSSLGLSAMALCFVSGMQVMEDPIPLLLLSLTLVALSTSWWLAFVPPDGYLRRLAARSAAPEAR